MDRFVGFYWTLPVNRRGFRALPTTGGVEAAARKSRTIRYQMELVRHWVADIPGEMVDEFAFMEVSPDRGTEAVLDALQKAVDLCKARDAELTYVRFSEAFNWRPHLALEHAMLTSGVKPNPLSPDPIWMDGQEFSPLKHFRHWKVRNEVAQPKIKTKVDAELEAVMRQLPEGPGRYAQAAAELEAKGIKTVRGLPLTAEGVRKRWSRRKPEQG